jgi:hypothetical protein
MYSPDPILVESVEEAVLEPRLLSSYSYGFDNPALYVDESGEQATSNQGANQARMGKVRKYGDRLLKAQPYEPTTEGRIGRFNSWFKKMEKESRGYEFLDDILGGSMLQIEVSFDGSPHINPKIMGIGLDDFRKKKKTKRTV